MKTIQYVRQEKAIAAASTADIRGRWFWGLRLLRDPEAFAPGSGQLRPGFAEQLVQACRAAGLTLREREIQYRLRCARTYPTEAQIARATAEFPHWTALVQAGFPTYDAPADEPPADHRTDAEREHDHAAALLDLVGEQGALFPLRDFEPIETTLKDLDEYTRDAAEMTERFAERDRKRRAYVDGLIRAADGDLSVTWLVAHERLAATEGTDVDLDQRGRS